jgi:hypothetical protein
MFVTLGLANSNALEKPHAHSNGLIWRSNCVHNLEVCLTEPARQEKKLLETMVILSTLHEIRWLYLSVKITRNFEIARAVCKVVLILFDFSIVSVGTILPYNTASGCKQRPRAHLIFPRTQGVV